MGITTKGTTVSVIGGRYEGLTGVSRGAHGQRGTDVDVEIDGKIVEIDVSDLETV